MQTELKNKVNELIERHTNEITKIRKYTVDEYPNTYKEKFAIKTKNFHIFIKDDGTTKVWSNITKEMTKCKTIEEAETLVFKPKELNRDITYKTEVIEMIDRHAHDILRYNSEPFNYDNDIYFYKFDIETYNYNVIIFCAECGLSAQIRSKTRNIIKYLYKIKEIEKYIFENRAREEATCDRILKCNSDWLEKAIAENDIYEIQLELSGLIIDELLRYINNKDIEKAVYERISELK